MIKEVEKTLHDVIARLKVPTIRRICPLTSELKLDSCHPKPDSLYENCIRLQTEVYSSKNLTHADLPAAALIDCLERTILESFRRAVESIHVPNAHDKHGMITVDGLLVALKEWYNSRCSEEYIDPSKLTIIHSRSVAVDLISMFARYPALAEAIGNVTTMTMTMTSPEKSSIYMAPLLNDYIGELHIHNLGIIEDTTDGKPQTPEDYKGSIFMDLTFTPLVPITKVQFYAERVQENT